MNRFSKVGKLIYKIIAKLSPVEYAKLVGVQMGEDVHIYGNAYKMFGTEPWAITLGNHVFITDEVRFVNHDGGTLLFRREIPDLEITKRINVGNNVYIGIRSIILPGVSIGDNVVVGAGSVVTHDLQSNYVYAGVPAKKIKPVDEYLAKLEMESLHVGHLSYKEKDDKLKQMI